VILAISSSEAKTGNTEREKMWAMVYIHSYLNWDSNPR